MSNQLLLSLLLSSRCFSAKDQETIDDASRCLPDARFESSSDGLVEDDEARSAVTLSSHVVSVGDCDTHTTAGLFITRLIILCNPYHYLRQLYPKFPIWDLLRHRVTREKYTNQTETENSML